jgi:hypothetical protein
MKHCKAIKVWEPCPSTLRERSEEEIRNVKSDSLPHESLLLTRSFWMLLEEARKETRLNLSGNHVEKQQFARHGSFSKSNYLTNLQKLDTPESTT